MLYSLLWIGNALALALVAIDVIKQYVRTRKVSPLLTEKYGDL